MVEPVDCACVMLKYGLTAAADCSVTRGPPDHRNCPNGTTASRNASPVTPVSPPNPWRTSPRSRSHDTGQYSAKPPDCTAELTLRRPFNAVQDDASRSQTILTAGPNRNGPKLRTLNPKLSRGP